MEFKPDIEKRVDRYRRFWDGKEIKPPLTIIKLPESNPVDQGFQCRFWQDPDGFVSHFIKSLEMRKKIPDDAVPMLRPPFGHATVPAALGAAPELTSGKLYTEPVLEDVAYHTDLAVGSVWLEQFEQYFKRLMELSHGRFAMSLCELPGPSDLMGYLRGLQPLLLDLYDNPDDVISFSLHCADLLVDFNNRVKSMLADQERYEGWWAVNCWMPDDALYFGEHMSVTYSPELYEKFVLPANSKMLSGTSHSLAYIYYETGKHLRKHYLDRGPLTWVRSCDGDPGPDMLEKYGKRAAVSIHTDAENLERDLLRYGCKGVCYEVACTSIQQAEEVCRTMNT